MKGENKQTVYVKEIQRNRVRRAQKQVPRRRNLNRYLFLWNKKQRRAGGLSENENPPAFFGSFGQTVLPIS